MFENIKDEHISFGIKIVIISIIALAIYFGATYVNDNYIKSDSKIDNLIKEATQDIKDNPSDVKARVALSDLLLGNGKAEEAIANYKEALKIDKSYGPALLGIGVAYMKVNNNKQALKFFNKEIDSAINGSAANIDKYLEQAYFYKAKVLIKQKNYMQADKSLKESIKIAPLMSDTYVLLGRVSNKMNKREDAKKYFKKALKLNPGSKEAKEELFNLGK